MAGRSVEDLEVWKRGCQLAVCVYTILRDVNDYGLRDQNAKGRSLDSVEHRRRLGTFGQRLRQVPAHLGRFCREITDRILQALREFWWQNCNDGWLVVERQRAPRREQMEFRGLADARPPATLRMQLSICHQNTGRTIRHCGESRT